MKTRLLAIPLLVAASFSGFAVTYGYSSPPKVVHMHAIWGEAADNLDELVNKSDVVAVIQPFGERESYKPFVGENDTFTDVNSKIVKSLKGDFTTNDTIMISQYGGEREDGIIEEWDDQVKLENGKSYLVFLNKINSESPRANKYEVVNGIEGAFGLEPTIRLNNAPSIEDENKNKDTNNKYIINVENEVALSPAQKEVISKGYEYVLNYFKGKE